MTDADPDYEEEPDRRPEERDLLEYREAGDPLALIRVFDALGLPLWLLAAHAEQDADRAVRLVERTFLELCDDAASWPRDVALLGWLAALVLRGAGSSEPAPIPQSALALAPPTAAELDLAASVAHAFETLPPILRQTLYRFGLRGLSVDEIAESLHVDADTVRSRLGAAIKHLKAELPPEIHAAADLTASGSGLGRARLVFAERVKAVAPGFEPPSTTDPIRRPAVPETWPWLAGALVVVLILAWWWSRS